MITLDICDRCWTLRFAGLDGTIPPCRCDAPDALQPATAALMATTAAYEAHAARLPSC